MVQVQEEVMSSIEVVFNKEIKCQKWSVLVILEVSCLTWNNNWSSGLSVVRRIYSGLLQKTNENKQKMKNHGTMERQKTTELWCFYDMECSWVIYSWRGSIFQAKGWIGPKILHHDNVTVYRIAVKKNWDLCCLVTGWWHTGSPIFTLTCEVGPTTRTIIFDE